MVGQFVWWGLGEIRMARTMMGLALTYRVGFAK
jgi:hypothetical protein